MAWGAQGVISVLSNPYPAETQALAEALLAQDLVTARRIQADLLLGHRCFVQRCQSDSSQSIA
ncbi:hypothetical protein OVA29_18185 [Exiguobacterium sp. SL14]|nr:hypothetical protein [Exiguobacterium sp. SL14]MCY1692264.1 hypothetical protein [Exiguobacterium sp. SL14]